MTLTAEVIDHFFLPEMIIQSFLIAIVSELPNT